MYFQLRYLKIINVVFASINSIKVSIIPKKKSEIKEPFQLLQTTETFNVYFKPFEFCYVFFCIKRSTYIICGFILTYLVQAVCLVHRLSTP